MKDFQFLAVGESDFSTQMSSALSPLSGLSTASPLVRPLLLPTPHSTTFFDLRTKIGVELHETIDELHSSSNVNERAFGVSPVWFKGAGRNAVSLRRPAQPLGVCLELPLPPAFTLAGVPGRESQCFRKLGDLLLLREYNRLPPLPLPAGL